MKSVSTEHLVDSTLESIENRLPAYRELAHKFGPLLREKAKLRDAMMQSKLALPVMNPNRFAAGVPLLVDEDMRPWAPELKKAKDSLLPLLADVLQLDDEACKALHDHLDEPDIISGLAQARIEGNWKHFEDTSVQLGTIPPTSLLYISETVFTPVLCVIADRLGKSLSTLSWEHGYCPMCGSTPSISYLSAKEVTDLDSLVGGGGKKFLHCSLCGHDWRFKRNICAACGNDENESREVFYSDEVKFERIEACHKCGTYCLNIDMRECEEPPHLDAVQIGLIHLDMIAHEKNLNPISPTIWNTVG